jgi:hypothetical protein
VLLTRRNIKPSMSFARSIAGGDVLLIFAGVARVVSLTSPPTTALAMYAYIVYQLVLSCDVIIRSIRTINFRTNLPFFWRACDHGGEDDGRSLAWSFSQFRS